MKILGMLAWLLMVAGGLNWGLVGAFDFNLVSFIFGDGATLEKVVYIAVGVATIVAVGTCCCKSKQCGKKS